MKKLAFIFIFLFMTISSYAGTITRYKTYATGDSLTAANLNGNFDNAYNVINGGMDNQNANVDGGFRFIEILDALPAAGNQGRVIFYTVTNTLYFDNGSSLIAVAVLQNTQTFSGDNTFTGTSTFTGNSTFAGTTIADLGAVTTADINAGTVDATIGATTPAAGTFTTVTANTSMTLSNTVTEFSTDDTLGGDSDSAIPTEQAVKAYVDSISVSNVIFSWSGIDISSSADYGVYVGTSLTGQVGGGLGQYLYLINDTSTYRTLLNFKYKHYAANSTVTIYARLWSESTHVNDESFVNIDIGGQSATAKSVASSTSTWYAGSSTIDVSGLTGGTVYDGIIQLKSESSADVYCSAVILIVS